MLKSVTFMFRYTEAENVLKLWESLGFTNSEQILMVNIKTKLIKKCDTSYLHK
jgi:hypothetical protein